MTLNDDDVIEILKAYPQTSALARFERATGVLHLGVRALLNNPLAAKEALTAQELQAFGRAVTEHGQNLVARGENLTAMGKKKAAEPTRPAKACRSAHDREGR
jgi:hypothetical protein